MTSLERGISFLIKRSHFHKGSTEALSASPDPPELNSRQSSKARFSIISSRERGRGQRKGTFLTTQAEMEAMLSGLDRKHESTNENPTRSVPQSPEPGIKEEEKEKESDEDDVEDLNISLDGLDVGKLAIDGKLVSTVLEEVFRKCGLDLKDADSSPSAARKKKLSPVEMKVTVQNQIILQLGRYVVNSVIDKLFQTDGEDANRDR